MIGIPLRFRPRFLLLSAAVPLFGLAGCGSSGGPLSPEQAAETFRIVDGFRLELFAAEPLVMDPVEIAFDADGGAYVAELADNPEDPPEGVKPESRIVYLEDTDADGKADRRTVFADGLLSVEGVQSWKGGVFVAAAPDILYLKDEDGDRKADVREVWYSGFDTINNVEGRVSNPRLALDNWIYLANQGRPGRVSSPKFPEMEPLEVRGWDVRFDPLTGRMERASGPSQFGLTFDEYGRRFISQNTIHLRHVVAPAQYVLRNPYLVSTRQATEISADGRPAPIYPTSEPQQWRVERTAARQERYDETQPGRVEQLGGFFTAAAGSTAYVGDGFGEQYRNTIFTGAGNGNLVHVDRLEPDGSTFAARGMPPGSDFLTSTDNWFRPVNFANAPDGMLYVVDYYRQYLEHPQFIPDAIKKRLKMDFRNGDDRGRIYRIAPVESSASEPRRRKLSEASSEELVDLLAHPNGWHRRTAQRLLLERQDKSVAGRLRATASGHADSRARIHALRLLEGLRELPADSVEAALRDESGEVRTQALVLAEQFLPELSPAVIERADDPSTHVALQAAFTLGLLSDDRRALDALAGSAVAHIDDEWFRLAALSAPPQAAMPLLTRLLPALKENGEGEQELIAGLTRTIGARRESGELRTLLARLTDKPALRAAGLRGLADGLALEGGKRLHVPGAEQALLRFLDGDDPTVRDAAARAARYFETPAWTARMRREAADEAGGVEQRVFALRALRGADFDAAGPILRRIVVSPSPQAVKAEAVATLAEMDDPAAGEILLEGWSGYDAGTRAQAADALMRHRDRVGLLLGALENGTVQAESLEEVTRIRLSQFPDPEIRRRAAQLAAVSASDREQVLAEYKDVLDLTGDVEAGAAVFEKQCAKCHLRQSERGRIGPDLSGVNNHGRETLLEAILDPSGAVESRYTNYLIETADGRLYDGLVAAETPAAVTLRGENEDVTLLRSEIVEMRASRVSLMPEGLEETMSRQEMADVIAYLRAGL